MSFVSVTGVDIHHQGELLSQSNWYDFSSNIAI